MRETADQSGRAISAALELLGDRYVVICSEVSNYKLYYKMSDVLCWDPSDIYFIL